MQVILLDKILNLGNFGDKVNVKSGYARNFLVPQGKAVLASIKNIELFQERRSFLEKKISTSIANAKAYAEKINILNNITITAKASEDGKLFGSVGARDIINAIKLAGIEISKKAVRLPNGGLRSIGEHEVCFQIYADIRASLIIKIIHK